MFGKIFFIIFIGVILYNVVGAFISFSSYMTEKMNKTQKANFYSVMFLIVLAVALFGVVQYSNNQQRIKEEQEELERQKRIAAVLDPVTNFPTESEETKPSNPYGRYETMEDGSRQFVYYSHKAMVEDYGYDPCHEPGDMDFEAPDSWAWDDWSEQYYRPGEIIWHDDLDSSAISEVGYDFEKEVLYVVFKKNDALYAYYDVPWDVWEDFLYDDSMGAYLNKNIQGKYEYERLD